MKKTTVLFCLVILPLLMQAKIKLPSILGDNMILQQQSDVKIWGKASINKKVKVSPSWTKETYSTKSDSVGNWLINIATPVAGGSYVIKITDGEELALKNILIGEVWFCSGQSNMEMPMKGFEFEPISGSSEVIASANESIPLRIFSTDFDENGWSRQYNKKPQEDCKGQWLLNNPKNVASVSATAYYFAKHLQKTLNIPIGIVVSSWGGSNVESWLSEDTAKSFNLNLSFLSDEKMTTKIIQHQPCVLFNSKVAPLTNYKIKGMLWYQGEENRHNPEDYSKMLPAMVKDYRNRWKTNFSFYYVEIAPYAYDNAEGLSAAYFREMQQKLMKVIPNSGMVSTIDIGSRDFIHPTDKEDVGKRLAYWTLAKDYGISNIGYCTPSYKSIEIREGKAFIEFENINGKVHPINQALESFEIAGDDKVFYPAEAIVDLKNKQLTVWSERVLKPVAVRYAFHNYAKASLFDRYGLPVAPFRTDNW
jgi:sialate O-acetylesterase